MNELLYSKDHTWVREEGPRLRVGISDFAQGELGEIAFVELPETGLQVDQGDAVCSIDSLKSTSEIYAPVAGTVVEVNRAVATEEGCGAINSDPLGAGWLFSMEPRDRKELQGLLDPAGYQRYLAEG
jgi:glycine cleavage system H protein